MQPQLMAVLLVVVSFTLLLSTIMAYLLLRKVRENRTERNIAAHMELCRSAMFAYLLKGESSRLLEPDGSRVKFAALEKLLDGCADLMSGEETEERIAAFADRHFAPAYVSGLRRRGWSRRMNILYRIERFRLASLEAVLLERLERRPVPVPAERVQICKLLAAWGSPALLERLSSRPETFSEFQRRLIVAQMPDTLFARFLGARDSFPREWQLAGIDLVGIRRRLEHTEVLISLLAHPEAEFRIRALKALGELPPVLDDARLLVHAEAADWQERTMAARLYGAVRQPALLPALQAMMSDGSWYVRSQAAQSLLAYPEGLGLLERIASHGADRYARDMAAEWAERGRLHG